jgi:hypothetical protein
MKHYEGLFVLIAVFLFMFGIVWVSAKPTDKFVNPKPTVLKVVKVGDEVLLQEKEQDYVIVYSPQEEAPSNGVVKEVGEDYVVIAAKPGPRVLYIPIGKIRSVIKLNQ